MTQVTGGCALLRNLHRHPTHLGVPLTEEIDPL